MAELMKGSAKNMSQHDDRHCASPPAKTKNVRDKSNVLGDVKIISEE